MYLVETVMEWKSLNENAKILDIIIFIIGCVVSVFIHVPWYVGGMVAINIYSGIITIVGIISMFMFFSSNGMYTLNHCERNLTEHK